MRYILDLHVVNHSFPTRLSSGVAQLELAPVVRDVLWLDENGDDLPEVHWNNPNARLLGLRRAAPMADDDGKTIEAVIALFNADGDAYNFRLPPPTLDYRLLIDSDDPDRSDLHVVDGPVEVAGHSLTERQSAV